MGVGATTLMPGNDATVTKTVDPDTGAVTLIFGIPAGEPGTGISVHICSSDEYDPTTRIPTVQDPEENTFYLVPSEDGASPDLFVEWIYTAGAWEQFGSATIDLSGYATVADTVLTTTLSMGRKSDTTVGTNSVALGNTVEASGNYSHAEGRLTAAKGASSHAEGQMTIVNGTGAHGEGFNTRASGTYSHAEGRNTSATGDAQHVSGKYNVEDSHASWPEWTANTSYEVGDKVKVTSTVDNETVVTGCICKVANTDASFTSSHWTNDYAMNFAEIIGNGATENTRSNAYALDWDGNGHYMGNVYVGANADSSGGVKLVSETDYATETTGGVIKVKASTNGLVMSNGILMTSPADSSTIKSAGTGNYPTFRPIVPRYQHEAVFYGLAKVAGADEKNSTNAVGTYTDTAKTAIKSMLGVQDGLEVVRLI